MEERGPLVVRPWMWISFLVAILLLVFNVDPLGDRLEQSIGKGAGRWVINLTLIGCIIYLFFLEKKRG